MSDVFTEYRDEFKKMYEEVARGGGEPQNGILMSVDLFVEYGGDLADVECGDCRRPYLECEADPCQTKIS